MSTEQTAALDLQPVELNPELTQTLDEEIQDERSRIWERLRKLDEKRQTWDANYLRLVALRNRLVEQGFEPAHVGSYNARNNEFSFECTQKDLPRVHKAWGRLAVYHKYGRDRRKREVSVTLCAVNHPGLTVHYITKIPRAKKGQPQKPCHWVKRVSYDLVCEIPQKG